MCLNISYVPSSFKNGLFVPVKKYLIQNKNKEYWITPYVRNYVLVCNNRSFTSFQYPTITSCAIHSFTMPKSKMNKYEMFDAYAVGVLAYGKDDDVASIGLYIPEFDTDGILDIKKMKRMNYDRRISYLAEVFPEMKNYKDILFKYQQEYLKSFLML